MTDVQKVILSIFKEIRKVCENHSIPYFAIGGTCIGAVRHKGFIPWDDDLDIAVPIEHFDFLLDCLRKEAPSYLYVIDSHDHMHYHYVWAKVCNKHTSFIEKSEFGLEDAYKGVFVDIMPISGIPEGKKRKCFYKEVELFTFLNNIRRFPVNANGIVKMSLKYVLKGIVSIFPYDFFSNKYLNLLRKYPFKNSNYTGYVWYPDEIKRLTFSRSFLRDTIDMPFEDTVISVPKEYDNYLSFQFGDYMKIPPIEQRMIHTGLVDIEHPYKYYYGKL